MGSVLELDTGEGRLFRLYLSGDNLYRPWLCQITDRLFHLDAAVLHLGCTTILGSVPVTMDGSQGADLVRLLKPSLTTPVHHNDYTAFRFPLSDFERAWHRRDLPGQLRLIHRGETISLRVDL